jgi:hypothetical protein
MPIKTAPAIAARNVAKERCGAKGRPSVIKGKQIAHKNMTMTIFKMINERPSQSLMSLPKRLDHCPQVFGKSVRSVLSRIGHAGREYHLWKWSHYVPYRMY